MGNLRRGGGALGDALLTVVTGVVGESSGAATLLVRHSASFIQS